MKKLLFATSVLVSLLCSCEKKENSTPTPADETPDKLVIKLEALFSVKAPDGTEYKTTFDSLNVKTVVKIDNEIIPQAVTASNGFPWTFEKEVSLVGKSSIAFELYPEFSIKDENNLPTNVNLDFTPTNGTFTFYKNGKPVEPQKTSTISWRSRGQNGIDLKAGAEEIGIEEIKKILENKSAYTSKGTIIW